MILLTSFQPARTSRVLACAAALAAVSGSPLTGTLRADPPAATSSSPAAAPLDATDTNALRPHAGESVTVVGVPNKSGVSKSGTVAYLNFANAHQGVALVFFLKPGQTGGISTQDDLKPYVGKKILVTGKLTDFKGDLQITVDSLTQIKDAP